MFENPRRGRQARHFTTNAPKILDLKSSPEQIFSRKLPLGAPEIFYLRLYFSWYLPARTANVNKPNRFCYYVQKGHDFRENLVSVIVSTLLILCLLISCYSWTCFLGCTYAKKQQCRTYCYKSLKSWKIDNIDFTRQFSLSIFTDFRYKSIKITWLLSIFIDTDFYRLTTPGINQTQ